MLTDAWHGMKSTANMAMWKLSDMLTHSDKDEEHDDDKAARSKRLYIGRETPTFWRNMCDHVKPFIMPPTCVYTEQSCMIYVGSVRDSMRDTLYSESHENVNYVLTCAKSAPCPYTQDVARCLKLSLVDTGGDLTNFISHRTFARDLNNFIREWYRDPGNMLIHCVFGRSRSVAISALVIYIFKMNEVMKDKPWDDTMTSKYHGTYMNEIYTTIAKKRCVVAMKENFMKQLHHFANCFCSSEKFRKLWKFS